MQIERRAFDVHLDVREAAQADAERRDPPAEHGRVAHAHEVGDKVAFVLAEQGVEVLAADFLFSLDDQPQVDGEPAARAHEALDRLHVDVDLPLVVDHAAAPEAAVTYAGLERGRHPFAERVDRLHVMVAVDEERGLARRGEPLGKHRGMACRRPHFDAPRPEAAQPLRRGARRS